jgi:hypothetical protein
MREKNLMNVTFAIKYQVKNKTSKAILNQFTRGRNGCALDKQSLRNKLVNRETVIYM